MKKRDFVLIILILLLAGGSALFYRVQSQMQTGGETYAELRIDGELIETYSLSDDLEKTIETEYGINRFEIKDGEVIMQEADCPDGYCVEQHEIQNTGEMIVCLPHHLIIEIKNSDTSVAEDTASDPSGENSLTYDTVAE